MPQTLLSERDMRQIPTSVSQARLIQPVCGIGEISCGAIRYLRQEVFIRQMFLRLVLRVHAASDLQRQG